MIERATDIGTPKIAISIPGDGYTLAHEIGHGKFWLRHPNNDPDHLRVPSDEPPTPGPFNIDDKANFMYSKKNDRSNRIRHYQWKKILSNQYKN